jgi:16S rRNA (guanine527-N7)-methyltransferase
MLTAARIAELLRPFVEDTPPGLAEQLRIYLELLLKWNARINLTAVRDPAQIVTRHFGESLFAARVLKEAGALEGSPTLSDIGSGAGFPGLPIKLFAPHLYLVLIESQNKKATFLREAIRTLKLTDAEVFGGRAEAWGKSADIVTLRAVEKSESAFTSAFSMVAGGGTLALLIGETQAESARQIVGTGWSVFAQRPIPESSARIVWMARRQPVSDSL